MTTTPTLSPFPPRPLARPWLLLLAGAALIVLANLRWGIGVLAWIAPVPLLAYLRVTRGWRSRAALAGVIVLAWIAAIYKIVTAPLPIVAPIPFGLVVGTFQALPYLTWDLARRRLDARGAILAFPALVVIFEWMQAHVSPLGGWGAAAYTQLADLPLLQLAALVGTAGVAFLVAWIAAAAEHALASTAPGRTRPLAAAAAAVVLAHGFGVARLALGEGAAPVVQVAAVGTDATFGGPPLPDAATRARIDDALFARTRAAARAGARLVVWTEAATLVSPADEPAFLARAAQVARDEHIELVAGYITASDADPLPFQNHYAWLRPDGALAGTYEKQRPVPGEPAIAGSRAPAIVDTAFGRATGVICYDADFPGVVRDATADGVDLLVVPSSDWRGIDPIHTEMAAVRAVEGGFSLLRSTRLGLSAGFDAYGHLRGALSSFESDQRTLMVTLPARRVRTIYRAIGDTPVLACAGLLALALIRRRRAVVTGS
jgi:apolipoprotein N-acyltransferase